MPLGLTDLLLPGAVLTALCPAAVALLLQVWMCLLAPVLSGKGKTALSAHPPSRASARGGPGQEVAPKPPNTALQPQKQQQGIQDILMSPLGPLEEDGSFHSVQGCL